MKLSENMLNFLGYAVEEEGFVSRDMAVGLAYPLGVASALKNGIMVPVTRHYTSKSAIPGIPPAWSVEGYELSERGRELGEIGKRMRSRATSEDEYGSQVDRITWEARKAELVREGQAKLKEWDL